MVKLRQGMAERLTQDQGSPVHENPSAGNQDSEPETSFDPATIIRRSEEGKNEMQRDIDDHFSKNQYTKAETELHDRTFIPEWARQLFGCSCCSAVFSFCHAHANILFAMNVRLNCDLPD